MPERIDDPELEDDDLLWRRVPDNQQAAPKPPLGESVRPSSAAFIDDLSKEVSVFVEKLKTREAVLDGYPDQGLVTIRTGVPRGLNYIVGLTPEVPDPAHRVIVPGPEHSGTGRKSDARNMAKAAVWSVLPKTYRDV